MVINKVFLYAVEPSKKVQDSLFSPQGNTSISAFLGISSCAGKVLRLRRSTSQRGVIRTGEVERIKKMLEDKAYKVDTGGIAHKMLDAYLSK